MRTPNGSEFLKMVTLLLMLSSSGSAVISIDNVKSLLSWSYEVYSKLNEAYDAYGTFTADVSLETIIAQGQEVSAKIDQLSSKIDQKIDNVMHTLIRRLPLIQKRDAALRDLAEYVNIIDRLYDAFERYTADQKNYNNDTLFTYAESVVSPKLGDLPDTVWKIYRLVAPGHSELAEGIFTLIGKETQESARELCDTGFSPQQKLLQLYETLITAEMKAFVMTSFAYSFLAIYKNNDYRHELKVAEQKFEDKAELYLLITKKSMRRAPRDIRRCDPRKYVRGTNFFEFEHLMQSYIVNEADLTRTGSCDQTCTTLPHMARHTSCYDKNYCTNKFCDGRLVECRYAGGPMRVCQLSENNPRRYEWFTDDTGTNGDSSTCENGKVQAFYGWQRFTYQCDYCLCTCMQDKYDSYDTVRTISFLNQMAEISNHQIVTGIRFVEQFGMIIPQVLQGPLLPKGQVESRNQSWTPFEVTFPDIEKSERDHWGSFGYLAVDEDEGITYGHLQYGRDYGMISNEQRQVNLDDILLPENYVVTGVRFKHPKHHPKPWDFLPIRLEVHGTPFDYETGKLIPSDEKPSQWFNADNMPNRPDDFYGRRRRELLLQNPGNPTASGVNLPDSQPNTFVKFQKSDLRKDAGQSTVPFFDGLQVGGKNSFPLGGVGIFHKGYEGSGGFLSFRVFSIDLSLYIEVDEPEEDDEKTPTHDNSDVIDYDPEYV